MGAMASTAVRRPHRRPPRRTRWARRIGGMLGTAGLLGVAVLMGTWIAPSPDHSDAVLAPAPAPVAKAKPHTKGAKAKAKAKGAPKLTAKQLAARTAAVTVLRNQGYLPTREADFNPRHQLRVLIGYRNGDPLSPRRAFFFAGDRMIGNDSSSGSSTLKLAKSGNRWVTLAYGVYAPGGKEPVSTTKIRFDWNGTALTPAGTIPPSRIASG
jgi:LppP/LprE lipoprotein